MTRKKICFIVAVPGTAESFLKDHIKALSEKYDIYLVANMPEDYEVSLPGIKEVKHIAIKRNISPIADLKALNRLTIYFKKQKFNAVHSVTPKAGLITALAAKMVGIRHRTHIFTGQVWATRSGLMRLMLKSIDRLIARFNNHILVDGESQRQFLIDERVISRDQSQVLGAGSICGANTTIFTPSVEERKKQRLNLGISDNKIVFCYMGRLNREKGITELFAAFNQLAAKYQDAYLLLFGRDEENCLDKINAYSNIRNGENYLYYGSTPTPHLSLQAADIFCLPSYREGFGMSVVEASCLGIPVICSNAYGLADTMVDNQTGIRCNVGEVTSLYTAMEYLYKNPAQRKRMGDNGRSRVLELFPGNKIVGEWCKFYETILA